MTARVRAARFAHRTAVRLEALWDMARLSRSSGGAPEHLRIEAYLGHGSGDVVVRGRVLDDPEPGVAVEGERPSAAVRRTLARFLTDELPGVSLRVRVGDVEVEAVSDDEGYFDLRLPAATTPDGAPWTTGEVALAAPYRGVSDPHVTEVRVRVPGPAARFGVVSDVDDTILLTGAQRVVEMVRQTFTGSALTRLPFPGAPELYRALSAEADEPEGNPVFYVSSSPWNLHDFLLAFIGHRDFPVGPLLLRDLLGSGERRSHGSHKAARIDEVLDLHPDLRFVLIGDSGQHDAEIYAEVVRRHPGRILAAYIREVRLDRGDQRVEAVLDSWPAEVPVLLAHDSAEVAAHAAGLGLLTPAAAARVAAATAAAAAAGPPG